MMNKNKKKLYIEEMKEFFNKTSSVFVTHYQGLTVKQIDKLREECLAENIIIKLGQLGLIIDVVNKKNGIKETDKIGVLNNYPKDVVGAGDSLLILSALSLAAGADPWESTLLGSIASGVQVGKSGNTPLTSKDIAAHL